MWLIFLTSRMLINFLFQLIKILFTTRFLSRSQWPRSLRRGSAAACLLRLWVWIPMGAWTFVCCECCQVEVSATNWSLVQRSPTDCDASLCDLETSWMRRPWPTVGCCAKYKQTNKQTCFLNEYRQFIKTRYKEWTENLSVLTFKYFYIMADDLNLRWKIISLWHTYPSGNIIFSFQHQEDICVSFTLHISEFAVYSDNM